MNLAIIQARMGSSRLPNKVLMDLCGKPVLWHVVDRVRKAQKVDEIVIATTIERQDLQLVKFCADNDIRVYAGSESDVLDRYYQTAKLFRPDNVIRITSDCPLIDHEIIDEIIEKHEKENNDYTSNTLIDSYPDGLDCEVIKYGVLKEAWEKAELLSEREHVTPYIKKRMFKKCNVLCEPNKKELRWTLDTEKDYEYIKMVYEYLYLSNPDFLSKDIYNLLEEKPEINNINTGIIRNEGYLKSVANDRKIDE